MPRVSFFSMIWHSHNHSTAYYVTDWCNHSICHHLFNSVPFPHANVLWLAGPAQKKPGLASTRVLACPRPPPAKVPHHQMCVCVCICDCICVCVCVCVCVCKVVRVPLATLIGANCTSDCPAPTFRNPLSHCFLEHTAPACQPFSADVEASLAEFSAFGWRAAQYFWAHVDSTRFSVILDRKCQRGRDLLRPSPT